MCVSVCVCVCVCVCEEVLLNQLSNREYAVPVSYHEHLSLDCAVLLCPGVQQEAHHESPLSVHHVRGETQHKLRDIVVAHLLRLRCVLPGHFLFVVLQWYTALLQVLQQRTGDHHIVTSTTLSALL